VNVNVTTEVVLVKELILPHDFTVARRTCAVKHELGTVGLVNV
jgi:hypothetical protein